jgi:predicted transcriptional regulator
MNKTLVLLIIITLISCKKETASLEKTKEIPEALKDKSYSRGSANGNLVEEVYQELVSKSPELQKIETEIENFDTGEIHQKYYNYTRKSENYYATANHQAQAIKDSVTRKRILALLEKNNQQYLEKSKELKRLYTTINDKKLSIEDSHTVLKIVLTLPVMAQYQQNNLPDKKEFEDKIKSEDSLIHAIQSKTSKY